MLKHEYSYCYSVAIPRYVYVPEHDDFIDGLSLNYDAVDDCKVNVAEYAKSLVKTRQRGAVCLRDVSLPPNVYNLDDFRHGDEAA